MFKKLKNKRPGSTRRGLLLGLASALIGPLMYAAPSWSHAAPGDIRIVAGNSGALGTRVIENLRVKFPTSQVVTTFNNLPKKGNLRYIAVGSAALQGLLAQNIEDPIFTLLVSRTDYRDILETMGRTRASNITAIYANASPEAQMQLARRLFKRETRIAVLYSSKTLYLLGILRQAAAQANIRLEFIQVNGENINRALIQASDASAIWAIADDAIYNAQNIRTILLSTYQRGQPVIGFSTSFVKAGALAATYSTVEDMATQLGEMVADYSVTGRVQAAQYPKYFSVLVNDNVARSLNVVIDDQVRNFSNLASGRRGGNEGA